MEIVQAKAWPKWPEPCAAPLRWLIFPRAIARRPGSWELCPVDLVGLSRQKLNRGAAAHLRRCADAAERDRELPAPQKRPSVYTAPKRHLIDRLSPEQIDQLLADYRAGTSLRPELAKQYGISISTLARLVRRHGLRRHYPRIQRS